MCLLWEEPPKWTREKGRIWARGCFARVTGCNRCYQVEVSEWVSRPLFAFDGVWKEHGMREIVRDEEQTKGIEGEREREREREQRARVRDRRSRVAVDMKHPSMKQAPSLLPSRFFLSHSLSLRLFLIPSSLRRLLAPLTTPAYTHSPSNASTFSLLCTYPP